VGPARCTRVGNYTGRPIAGEETLLSNMWCSAESWREILQKVRDESGQGTSNAASGCLEASSCGKASSDSKANR
jgi:hypothetical protein